MKHENDNDYVRFLTKDKIQESPIGSEVNSSIRQEFELNSQEQPHRDIDFSQTSEGKLSF